MFVSEYEVTPLRRWLSRSAVLWVLVLVALSATPASAAQPRPHALAPIVSLGSATLFSDPSCASPGKPSHSAPTTAVCAAVGPGRTLMVDHYTTGIGWGGWVALSGTVTSAPTCFPVQDFEVWCGVRDDQDRLATYTYHGTAWTGPFAVGGVLDGAPSCVALNEVTAFCAARAPGGTGIGSSGGIFGAEFKGKQLFGGGAWTILPVEPENMYSDVSCTSDTQALADAHCIWLGDGGAAQVRRFVGELGSWAKSAGTIPGGAPIGSPACTPYAIDIENDGIYCFAVGRDATVYYTENDLTTSGVRAGPDDFAGWQPLYDTFAAQFGCGPTIDNGAHYNFICAMTGTNSGGLLIGLGGSEQEPVVGQFVGKPSCFVLDTGYFLLDTSYLCVSRNNRNVAFSQEVIEF